MAIKLKVKEFDLIKQELQLNEAQMAARIGVSTTQLWRARLPDEDIRHNDPGAEFIAGTLNAFDKKFEDLFFLDNSLRDRNKTTA